MGILLCFVWLLLCVLCDNYTHKCCKIFFFFALFLFCIFILFAYHTHSNQHHHHHSFNSQFTSFLVNTTFCFCKKLRKFSFACSNKKNHFTSKFSFISTEISRRSTIYLIICNCNLLSRGERAEGETKN